MVILKDISGFTGLTVFIANRCLNRNLNNRWTLFCLTLFLTFISFIIELIVIFIGTSFEVYLMSILILGITLFSSIEYIIPFIFYRRYRLKDSEIHFRIILLINKLGDLANLILVGFIAVFIKYSSFTIDIDIPEEIISENGLDPIIFLYWWYFMIAFTSLQLICRILRLLIALCIFTSKSKL